MCFQSGGYNLDFSGPPNWNGECTTANAIPAGLECPLGSGIPCVVSVSAAPLVIPSESCAVSTDGPPVKKKIEPRWLKTDLGCILPEPPTAICKSNKDRCAPEIPPEFAYCVSMPGMQACPVGSAYKNQFVVYDHYNDSRACTECSCGDPTRDPNLNACEGYLKVYGDGACASMPLFVMPLTEEIPNCLNVIATDGIGSKEVVAPVYNPGTCEASGGKAVGSARPDDASVMTRCCMDPSIPH